MKSLDAFLIRWTEYFVHYLILYKSYTWKEIGTLLNSLNRLLSALMVLFLALTLIILNPLALLMFAILGLQKNTEMHYTSALTKRSCTTIPRERVTRIFHRFLLLMCTILIFTTCVRIFIAVENDTQNPVDSEIYTCMFFIFFVWITSIVCVLAIEYFLCTSPPPPGEKERRLAEKEMRNLIPQRITD